MGSIIEPKPISLRDAFLRSNFSAAIPKADPLQVEEIQEYFDKDSPYKDLVEFERDIAQISELVLLFSEAPGSFAELGSFSSYPEIFSKLLVVIQSIHLKKSSFILKGPINSLRNKHSNSVFSITNTQVGIKAQDFSGVSPERLIGILKDPIEQRLSEARSRTTFQRTKFGHRCKLYVGLLREFSVLKDAEIISLFQAFGIRLGIKALNRIAFCCKCVRWSNTSQAGFDRIHFPLEGNEAASFKVNGDLSDKLRRRIELRKHWADNDPARIEAQIEAVSP